MGALPKERTSNARQGKRRSHHHLELPTLDTCPECRQKKVSHHVCLNCGYYRGRQVLQIKESGATE